MNAIWRAFELCDCAYLSAWHALGATPRRGSGRTLRLVTPRAQTGKAVRLHYGLRGRASGEVQAIEPLI